MIINTVGCFYDDGKNELSWPPAGHVSYMLCDKKTAERARRDGTATLIPFDGQRGREPGE